MDTFSRRRALALGAAGLAAAGPSGGHAAGETKARPNIILIVLDDVGFSDLGCFGSEIHTPNIDGLAQGGLRYNRFDSRAICSATRAALLTGRNNQTVRMGDLPSNRPKPDPNDLSNIKGELPDNVETVAQALQSSGYATFAVGKWHLTPEYEMSGEKGQASWPRQRGFDGYYGFLSGWTDQYKPSLVQDNAAIPTPTTPGYHLSVDLVDHAIGDIKASRAAAPDKPVFMYLALGAAHTPIQAPREYIDRYAHVYDEGWDALRPQRLARMKREGIVPADTVLPPPNPGDRSWASLSAEEKTVFARFMATYAGFLTHADEQIGRLLAYLKSSGQFENSLVVLISDNGAAPEGGQVGGFRHPYFDPTTVSQMAAHLDELGGPTTQALYQRPWAMAGVTPFRRYKLWPYAGGIRTPLIVSWPTTIKDAGAIRTQFVDTVDVAPTLLDAARAQFHPVIGKVPQLPVAGRSIRASFTAAHAPSARETQYFELRGNRAITSGPWKAIAMHKPGTDFAADRWQLFNTAVDYSESTDLAARQPAKLKELQALWWTEARRYATPALQEAPGFVNAYHLFDDAFLEQGH